MNTALLTNLEGSYQFGRAIVADNVEGSINCSTFKHKGVLIRSEHPTNTSQLRITLEDNTIMDVTLLGYNNANQGIFGVGYVLPFRVKIVAGKAGNLGGFSVVILN